MNNMSELVDTHLKPILDAIHIVDSERFVNSSGYVEHCYAYRTAFRLIRILAKLDEDDAAAIVAAYNKLTAN